MEWHENRGDVRVIWGPDRQSCSRVLAQQNRSLDRSKERDSSRKFDTKEQTTISNCWKDEKEILYNVSHKNIWKIFNSQVSVGSQKRHILSKLFFIQVMSRGIRGTWSEAKIKTYTTLLLVYIQLLISAKQLCTLVTFKRSLVFTDLESFVSSAKKRVWIPWGAPSVRGTSDAPS